MRIFQDYQDPTNFDRTIIKVLFSVMTVEDREKLEQFFIETMGDDLQEIVNLARTILFVEDVNETKI